MSDRRIKVFLIVFSIVVVAMFLIIVFLCMDESRPDDSFLRLERLAVPDSENAFVCLQAAAGAIYRPDDSRDTVERLLDGDTWDDAVARDFVDRNAKALAALDKALQCRHFQVPAITGADTLLPYIDDWNKLSGICRVRASMLSHAGKQEEAFGALLQLVEFGHRVQGCGGALIHYSVGSRMKEKALAAIRKMLPETSLSADDLKDCAQRLGRFRANGEGLAGSFKVEYAVIANEIRMFRSSMRREYMEQAYKVSLPTSPYHLQPNRTGLAIAGLCMAAIAEIPKPYSEQTLPQLPNMAAGLAGVSPVKRYTMRNFTGTLLWNACCYDFKQMLLKTCNENVAVDATRVLVALKGFKAETGALPKSLDELVPEYFDKVPADPFDGKPFRYLPEKKIIYAVGYDLKDDGGAEAKEGEGEARDRVFKIEF